MTSRSPTTPVGWIPIFQTAADKARADRDTATANLINSIINSKNGRDVQEQMIKAQFFGAIDSNPLVGLMYNAISDNGTRPISSYVSVYNTARPDNITKVEKEIGRV